MEPVPLKRTNALIFNACDFLTHTMSGVCVCTARPPCSAAGRASYLGATPGALRSDGTWFVAKVAESSLDWVADAAAAALALALALAAVRPWVSPRVVEALLPAE